MYNIKIKYIGGIKVDMKIYNNKNYKEVINMEFKFEFRIRKLKFRIEYKF